EEYYTITPFIKMVQDNHLQDHMVLLFEPIHYNDKEAPPSMQLLQAGMTIAERFRKQGHEIFLIIDVTLANQLDITHVDIVRQFAWEKEVITIMVRGMTEDADQEPDLPDTTIVLSRELAKRGIWPAIDRQQSSSVLFENNLISEEHKQVMHAVKQI